MIKQHGGKAPLHVASRIGELAILNDHEGVETWRAIATRVDQLMDYLPGKLLSKQ
ncbi:hypothetical protein WG908_00775 [Sphingobium sp. AN641]|uniref:DUF6961 family protein n=1 Tax=Sphingobium sp. AN641 TaxID=3133443 RepID=UPI0030C4C0AB